jgi:hypothetical protein
MSSGKSALAEVTKSFLEAGATDKEGVAFVAIVGPLFGLMEHQAIQAAALEEQNLFLERIAFALEALYQRSK